MRILFRPRYDATAASSRLRVFAIVDAMERHGLASAAVSTASWVPDVVVNQKTDQVLRGEKLTVFDCDDDLPGIMARGIAQCDLLTVDTATRLRAADELAGSADCLARILPDCIDYEPAAPLEDPGATALCWFGNAANCESARWMFAAASKGPVRAWPTVAIAEQEIPGFNVSFIWQYRSFPRMLRECGLALLAHTNADQAKSENKMVAAITLGVPVVVGHHSPSYEALARVCGVEWSVARSAAQLPSIVERLTWPAERAAYLAATQPYVWENYRAEVIARRAVQLYKECM